MNFENNLVVLRKKCGMSQEELAIAVGVARQTIYSWEAGLNYPNIVMLKKLASILNVSTDDLLSGLEVSKLPATFKSINLSYLGKHEGEVFYDELPNWFITLKNDEEVCWALYDLKNNEYVRDYSYHIEVKGNVKVHDLDGIEIEIKEYNPDLSFSRIYNQYISVTLEGVAWIGQTRYKDNKKIIETYKDQIFLDDWGFDKKLIYQKMKYSNAEDYILEFDGKKQKVIKISYYDPDGSDDLKRAYFEVFLNQDFKSLIWRRYTKINMKNTYSNEKIKIANDIYDMDYYCLTSRLNF